jgi:hypothetical protein
MARAGLTATLIEMLTDPALISALTDLGTD